jgi:uncharacterized protein (TIGR00299 family) protein
MALGAFVDLGVDPEELRRALAGLDLSGWKLDFVRDERCGITGVHAVVDLGGDTDHIAADGDHDGAHDHHHHHECHGGGRSREDHHHHHTSWKDIRVLIEKSEIGEGAKKRALDIFCRIAEAEARVHGVSADDVTFHEVGAMDSIIDIAGAAICLDILKPEKITCGEIELGGGMVKCAHGILPVPAPATRILVRGLPVRTGGFNKEMTTPTGAAILASCVDEFITAPVSFREIKTGYGIGTRKLETPNVLQVSWRDVDDEPETKAGREMSRIHEELLLLEANIDDMTGEALGFLMERFFDSGALDVVFTPVTMKKSRPGVTVSVLCRRERAGALGEVFFRHSTTIGFRESAVNRVSLRREVKTVAGGFGAARKKIVYTQDGKTKSKIEYEDRARLARAENITLDEAEAVIRGAPEEA